MGARKNISWITILRRRGPLLFNNFVIFGQSRQYFFKMLDFDFEIRNFRYIDGEISIDSDEVGNLAGMLAQKMEPDSTFLDEFLEKCGKQCDRLLTLAREIQALEGLTTLTAAELKRWFERYVEEVLRMMPFLNIFAVMDRMFGERILAGLKRKLAVEGKEDLAESYMHQLVFPSEDNYVVREIDELTELGAYIQSEPEVQDLWTAVEEPRLIEEELRKIDPDFLAPLANHAVEFGFLNMYTYEGSPMTVADVIRRLKDMIRIDCQKRLAELRDQKTRVKRRYGSIVRKLGISGQLLRMIEHAQKYTYFRLHRLDVLFIAGCLVRDLLQEIARRMGLQYGDVVHLWHKEILDFFDTGTVPDRQQVESRKKGYATLYVDSQLEILTGKELGQLIEETPEERRYDQVREMQGVVASSGQHTGPAKIVMTEAEAEKVEVGDVLVSTMTNPYYVPAMIRAGAIVTDEGGILSHAALVARELLKPCVIGTDIATKALKDGDVILVDATRGKGLVRVISSSWRRPD